jgi:hypothetical protein
MLLSIKQKKILETKNMDLQILNTIFKKGVKNFS